MSRANQNAAKITVDDVRLIRALIAERDAMADERAALRAKDKQILRELSGLTNAAIGNKFNLTRFAVNAIASGRNWANVN